MNAPGQSLHDPLIGRTVGDGYVVEEVIGSGAMGRVYRAFQLSMERVVAIKVLHPELRDRPQLVARFLLEGRLAARINHPNALAVLNLGTLDDGAPFLVMEYLRGQTLREALSFGPLHPNHLRALFRAVLTALAEAHAHGIIHRDVKPDNVVLEPRRDGSELVKVIDFGLAAQFRAESTRVTQPGFIVGTPAYMSPEQIRGGDIDGRADLYSVAVMLFEALTGKLPFDDEVAGDVLKAHLRAAAPVATPARGGRLPRDLLRVIARGLAKTPSERFASAEEMRDAIDEPSSTQPTPPHRVSSVRLSKQSPDAGRRDTGFDLRGFIAGLLDGADDGVPRIVRGPHGSGKSYLLSELRSSASATGAFTVVVEPHPARVDIPYAGVRSLVASVSRQAPGLEAAQRREDDGPLARAGWSEIDGSSASPGREGAARPGAVVEAVSGLLVAAARANRASSILILVDDAAEVDASSNEVLRRLSSSPLGIPLRIVLFSVRTPSNWGALSAIDIGPDDGIAPPPLYASAADDGGISLRERITLCLEGLPVAGRRFLQSAAVLGVAADLSAVKFVSGVRGAFPVDFGLAKKTNDEVILPPLVREVVLASIPFEARRELHDRARTWCERNNAPPEISAEHAYLGTDGLRALAALDEVALRALRRGDTEAAIVSYQRKLRLAREELARNGEEMFEQAELAASVGLGVALAEAGRLTDAHGVLAEALSNAPVWSLQRPSVLLALGDIALRRGRPTQALSHFQELALRNDLSPVATCDCLLGLARAKRALGTAGEESLSDLADRITSLAGAADRARLLLILAQELMRDWAPDARRLLEHAADAAYEYPGLRARALQTLASLELCEGRHNWALVLARRAATTAAEAGDADCLRACEKLADEIRARLVADELDEQVLSLAGNGGPLLGTSVLVVDDNEDALTMARIILGRAGATVVAAESVPEAMEILRGRLPTVVLSDLSMPGEDGYALLRSMRALGGGHAETPAIALSALATNEERAKTAEAGFLEHLAKPVEPDRLVKAVEDAARADHTSTRSFTTRRNHHELPRSDAMGDARRRDNRRRLLWEHGERCAERRWRRGHGASRRFDPGDLGAWIRRRGFTLRSRGRAKRTRLGSAVARGSADLSGLGILAPTSGSSGAISESGAASQKAF